jgi:formylmethanofuran dehydrogenase subunit E
MHKPVLTNKITKQRCEYLYGQWTRGHLYKKEQIIPKIRAALPARENEISALEARYISYLRDEHDVILCERCGEFSSCWDYFDDEQVCGTCYDELNGEEN